MKENNKKSKKALILVLYGLAIILGAYTLFTMYNSYTYISSLVSQGLVISDELQSIVSYCVGASVPYMFYSISIWSVGYIISRINKLEDELKMRNSEDIIEEDKNEEVIITDSNEDANE